MMELFDGFLKIIPYIGNRSRKKTFTICQLSQCLQENIREFSDSLTICDLICKNPEQSRIFENSDFCIMVFCISKAFFCSSIKSVIQIDLMLQG